MSKIINFCVSIIGSLGLIVEKVLSFPGLIVVCISSLIGSLSSLFANFTGLSSQANSVFSSLSNCLSYFSSFSQIFTDSGWWQLAGYSLGLDFFAGWLVSNIDLFLSLLYSVFVFIFISLPSIFLPFLLLRLAFWVISLFLPVSSVQLILQNLPKSQAINQLSLNYESKL